MNVPFSIVNKGGNFTKEVNQSMKKDLQSKIDSALNLEDILALENGLHIAENVVGDEIYIFRNEVGNGYSMMFRTNKPNELYVEDFDEDGNLINVHYDKINGED